MNDNEKNLKTESLPLGEVGGALKSPLDLPAGRQGGDIVGPEVGGALTRKEFINSAVRYGILAVIFGLVVFLATKRKATPESICDNDFACGNCNKRGNCKASPNPSQRGAK